MCPPLKLPMIRFRVAIYDAVSGFPMRRIPVSGS